MNVMLTATTENSKMIIFRSLSVQPFFWFCLSWLSLLLGHRASFQFSCAVAEVTQALTQLNLERSWGSFA